MRVQMQIHITGYRDGEPWPPVGGTVDVPEREALELISQGYAKAVEDGPVVEAVGDDAVEADGAGDGGADVAPAEGTGDAPVRRGRPRKG